MTLIATEQYEDFAKSIKVEVMYRVLDVLCVSGPKKITNLAMLSGLNHITCRKYSNLMELLSWVKISKEEKNTIIIATETGKHVWEKLQMFQFKN